VCASLPRAKPSIPSWPASCVNQSSCTAACSGDLTGNVTVFCSPSSRWLRPLQRCLMNAPGGEGVSKLVTLQQHLTFVLQKTERLDAPAEGKVTIYCCRYGSCMYIPNSSSASRSPVQVHCRLLVSAAVCNVTWCCGTTCQTASPSSCCCT
jgi:hypothetical protein